MSGDLLPLAVRAYAEAISAKQPQARKRSSRRRDCELDPARRPKAILVFDCETTTGPEQALLFGCYRYYSLDWLRDGPELTCQQEGLLFADELPAENPAGHQLLERYARADRLRLCTRTEFVERVFLPALSGGATVVTFNAPFDLSRIATGWSLARGKRFEGGFSFTLATYIDKDGAKRENGYRPRLRVRPLDSKRAHIGLGLTRPGSDPDRKTRNRGAFLDLRTLADALSSESHSLESGCTSFGVTYRKRAVEHGQITADYIDYCREDVAGTAALYQALAREYERHGLRRAPTRIYSPASLAKAYMHEAGIRPPLQRQRGFPREVLGYSMAAYYGGRAECRIRRIPVPVAYLDFASMYATGCCLLGLWRFHTCGRIDVVDDDSAEVERWLARLTLDDVFDPVLWPELCGLALVAPKGDLLPVRARYRRGGGYGIGVNPLTSSRPLWYPLPDLVVATLLGGRPPRILRVLRFRPAGRATGLRPLSIRGADPIDPYSEDVFRALVEQRRRLEERGDEESLRTAAGLKTVASTASYGISAELNRQEAGDDRVAVSVYGLDRFSTLVRGIEEPGEYFFPPLAALATAAARLMLALLERLVTAVGGGYAFCDTDSMAIIASQHGGPIPCPGGHDRDRRGRECVHALSWWQLDRIIDRFQPLNPYNRQLVPSILKLERENYDCDGKRRELSCYAVSAKRYCLYTLDPAGQPSLVKWSEHALGGFYLNPIDADSDDRDWTRQAWRWIIETDALGRTVPEPAWLDRPALTRFTASHPRLLNPFRRLNHRQPYRDQIKPANFLLVAHPTPGGHPRGTDPSRFVLIAPYNPGPSSWNQLLWCNIHNPKGPSYRLATTSILDRGGHPLDPDTVAVKTYNDVLVSYRTHPEPKSLAPDGTPCRRNTTGLLHRRPVQAAAIAHIGKEANLLDQIAAGLVTHETDTLIQYDSRAVPRSAAPRSCDGCNRTLTGRQRRWCAACRADRRHRQRVARTANA